MAVPYLQLVPRNNEQEQVLNSLNTCSDKYDFIVNYYKNYTEELNCYCEVHHIVPISCNGEDSCENLVKLPASMHYVVHFLLPLLFEERGDHVSKAKMVNALIGFRKNNRISEQTTIIEQSYEYARIREEFIANLRGRHLSEKTKRKISEVQKGKPKGPKTEEHKRKLSEALKGRVFSKEAHERMSKAHLGRTDSRKGHFHTEQSKEKMRQAQRRWRERYRQEGKKIIESLPKMWIKNEQLKKSCLISKNAKIPEGWEPGRITWKNSN